MPKKQEAPKKTNEPKSNITKAIKKLSDLSSSKLMDDLISSHKVLEIITVNDQNNKETKKVLLSL